MLRTRRLQESLDAAPDIGGFRRRHRERHPHGAGPVTVLDGKAEVPVSDCQKLGVVGLRAVRRAPREEQHGVRVSLVQVPDQVCSLSLGAAASCVHGLLHFR